MQFISNPNMAPLFQEPESIVGNTKLKEVGCAVCKMKERKIEARYGRSVVWHAGLALLPNSICHIYPP